VIDNLKKEKQSLNLNKLDKFGNTAIGLVCVEKPDNSDAKSNQLEILKLLLDNNACPNIENKRTRWTTVTWAARHGMLDVLTVLV